MPSQYSKGQLLKIYQTLPEPLKEVLGSAETQDEIDAICRENQVTETSIIDNVYNLTMDVFMGLVTPEDFEKELGQMLQGQADSTQEIAHRIRRFILFPLKAEIAQLHKMETISPQAQPKAQTATGESYTVEPEGTNQEPVSETMPRETKESDPYREAAE